MERVGFSFSFFSVAYLSRLLAALAFLSVTGYLNAVSSNLAGYRNPQIKITGPSWAKGTTTLPDLGHDLIGSFTRRYLGTDYIDWYELPDHFVNFLGTAVVIFLVVHPRRFLIIRRLALIFGMLNLLRSFTVIITSLPDASPSCALQFTSRSPSSYKDAPISEALFRSLLRGFLLIIQPSSHITCGDMVFSGHACFLTLASLVFHTYCRSPPPRPSLLCALARYAVAAIWALGVVAIVGTKLHYTLDVFLAVLLTGVTWRAFHQAVEVKTLREHYGVIRWMEAESIIEVDERAYERFVEKNKLD
jgi:shingomyelin synthase